ncbi:MAG: hypothetical protein V4450_14780 [Bacteroidota bacterium]
MRKIILLLLVLAGKQVYAQELYVFSEPASNMPAHSLSVKQTAKWLKSSMTGGTESRHTTELMFGVNKNLMIHAAGGFSDMYSSNQRFESAKLYGKYRFYSNDALYSHFRMAAFAEASYSRNKPMYDELSLDGDQSGIQAGFIATQLLHKLAVSSTVSFTKVLQDKTGAPVVPYDAFNYSLSAGYLILPKTYKNYNQTNFNLYAELIGQRTTDLKRYYVDLAPAAQLIFNSTAKLNMGYRFELSSNMHRMADRSWLLSFEWLFLNALK